MKVISSDNTQQTQKLIDAATQIKNAGWTFSGAAQGINNAGWNAVGKLKLQADQTSRSATAAEDAVKATQTQMRLDQRAWIAAAEPVFVINETSPISATVSIRNVGKTPGAQVSSKLHCWDLPKNQQFTLDYVRYPLDPLRVYSCGRWKVRVQYFTRTGGRHEGKDPLANSGA
jgi:hypothetical protein